MNRSEPGFSSWVLPLAYRYTNWISLTGIGIVTVAGVSWFVLLPTLLQGATPNPYIGILGFLILPAAFLLGLILIPVGIVIRRAALRKKGEVPEDVTAELGSHKLRQILVFLGVMTVVNLLITTQWTYSAVGYMDSSEFCGTACHPVMEPEYVAHQTGVHSRVPCIECHAGAGASGFIRAKLAGVNQLFAKLWNSYERPISLPVTGRPPASETCLRCHSLGGAGQQKVKIIRSFSDDESNSPSATVLVMNIGAIHRAHTRLTDGKATIRYSLEAASGSDSIPWVEVTRDGTSTVFATAESSAPPPEAVHEMDCMDCHNRPAHTFQTPERALDDALLAGAIPADLPFAKQQGLEILQADYSDADQAAERIPAAVADYYRQSYPAVAASREQDIQHAGEAMAEIYRHNVFPAMNVTWRTYPNQLGHMEWTGCFRCHNYELAGPEEASISQDCSLCHTLVAIQESSPAALTDLGIE